MSSLYLPPSVTAEAENRGKEKLVDERIALGEMVSHELQRMDPNLRLARVGDDVDPRTGFWPGCWYIRKIIPGEADEWLPLIDDDTGQYLQPGAWVFDWLQAGDLWDPRVFRDRKEAKRKLREARVRARNLEKEQRRDVMLEDARAAMRLKSEAGLTKRTDLKR